MGIGDVVYDSDVVRLIDVIGCEACRSDVIGTWGLGFLVSELLVVENEHLSIVIGQSMSLIAAFDSCNQLGIE